MQSKLPVVLCFSGHDPSGGAGIQADIESLNYHQCHACSVITAITEQDSHNVKQIIPQNARQFKAQALTLLNDMEVRVFKIGLVADLDILFAICTILDQYSHIPVIFDPVLSAGGGLALSNETLINAMKHHLVSKTSCITPNSMEARKLTGCSDLQQCAEQLMDQGCAYVLISGGHENPEKGHLYNLLYQPDCTVQISQWQRLPGEFHGSGCTLASAIAAGFAQGMEPLNAIQQAQDYTWNCIRHSYQTGTGQLNPDRLFKTNS